METLLSIALGLGLSVACGFRVFMPFLLAAVGSVLGYVQPGEGFEWIGTVPALIVFGTATVLEILAYYLPWVDNLMDTISTPVAVLAGALATASVLTDMPPLLHWTIALIGGGGAAGLVQSATATIRAGSTLATGGLGNFVVATFEWIGAAVTAILAIFLPLAAFAICLVVVTILLRQSRALRKNRHVEGP
ncbi:MAG: DUF4126 domain-containing protein [Ignavibacteria bacterium]|nr:DUF4126 domain-containing protein [Ignavibacteria bacterium]